MSRLSGLVLLLLLLARVSFADAAIAHVQAVTCQAVGVTSCTTAAITTTTGNVLVASTVIYSSFSVSSITDTKSNSYTLATSVETVPGVGEVRQDYSANAAGGSAHTFTLTTTGSTYTSFSVSEISGAATVPFDKTAGASDSSATTSHTTATTATTSQANELLLGLGGDVTATSFSASAGWTEITNITAEAGVMGMVTAWKTVTATGTQAFSYTTSASVQAGSQITTWKEAAAAAGTRQRCVGCGADGKVIE